MASKFRTKKFIARTFSFSWSLFNLSIKKLARTVFKLMSCWKTKDSVVEVGVCRKLTCFSAGKVTHGLKSIGSNLMRPEVNLAKRPNKISF